jgi:hypothetical protein
MDIEKYEDITFEMLGTRRQRPMYLSKFTKFRQELSMKDYPKDPHAYTTEFLGVMNEWVTGSKLVKYTGLGHFTRHDAILGTTHTLDELHSAHGKQIVTLPGEYKYHRRLTDFTVRTVRNPEDLVSGDVFVLSYPSCITTGAITNITDFLDTCQDNNIPVHIDGAWFGQCRNVELDVSHPAIKSVSVSLSKSFGMGSQRIGIRYTREPVRGPISIMNDFQYANVSDMWLGVESIKHFGTDYWWNNYADLYSRVCVDFKLAESNSIHVGWITDDNGRHQFGVRTPLRYLIEGIFDERGTDKGLNSIEKSERK